jgi:UDP-GlcNAc:undecaprenyl-phosphate GlcNAc-1-phosphate transferase
VSEAWPVVLALPAAIAALVIVLLAHSRLARVLVDHPNARSLHEVPTQRIGGIGLMAGALAVAAWCAGGRYSAVLACALALALLSAVDDWRSLPVGVRLPAHAAAAAIGIATLAWEAPDALGPALALALVLAIVWMTNLYNFMDGADGLAGLMTVIGFGAMSTAAFVAGDLALAMACAAIASAGAGFLAFNFPPARIFLGDAGSIPLGFLAATLGAHGAHSGAWPWWFPLLAFSPFVVDASVTLGKRLIRGERIWIAHRHHYYQRLVLGGWSARRLVAAEGLLMVCTAASALYALGQERMLQCGILIGWPILYVILIAIIEMKRDSNKNMNGSGARKSNGAPGEEE